MPALPFAYASRPVLLGHRGAPRVARENTLEAFQAALEAGLDGVEFDVQKTRDGVLVVHHDFHVEGAAIAELDWPDLKQRAPWVPRLEEVFELLDAYPEAYANVELKSQPPASDGREALLARALLAWPGRERAWVSSFDPLALVRLWRETKEIPLGLLYEQQEMLALRSCVHAEAVHPRRDLLDVDQVAALKAQGLKVVAWTVNDLEEARRLLSWGVDVLIGDDPEVLLAAPRNV